MNRRVVVTGLGCVTPLALDVPSLWNGILEGKSGIHPLTILDATNHKVRFGGDVPNFDPGIACEPKDLKRLDRFSLFAMWAAYHAIIDSGLDFSKEQAHRCGAIVGSGIGGLNEIEEQILRMHTKGLDRVSPFTIPKMMLKTALMRLPSLWPTPLRSELPSSTLSVPLWVMPSNRSAPVKPMC